MLTNTVRKTVRLVVLCIGLAAYLAFCWSLVVTGVLPMDEEHFLRFVAIWGIGLLLLGFLRAPSKLLNIRRMTFTRVVWFNLGAVLAAVLVPNSLRFLILVVPLFGVHFAALRLPRVQLLWVAALTGTAYFVAALVLVLSNPEVLYFELYTAVAFTLFLLGSLYLAIEVFAMRARAESRHDNLKQSVAELSAVAMRDELTGVFNRRYIFESLERIRAQADREGMDFTVCYCDWTTSSW